MSALKGAKMAASPTKHAAEDGAAVVAEAEATIEAAADTTIEAILAPVALVAFLDAAEATTTDVPAPPADAGLQLADLPPPPVPSSAAAAPPLPPADDATPDSPVLVAAEAAPSTENGNCSLA